MLPFKRLSKQTIAVILFHIIFVAICIANFPFDKFFIGWDAINPELNFFINFRRALFAGWQENYGVGLLGGHGFAATLPHTLATFLFSLVFPMEAIRLLFTFLCWYLGGMGMYILSKRVLQEIRIEKFSHYIENYRPFLALFSALFYMLNLGTLQIFYVQLEAFIVHFAMLPWLFWIVQKLLENRTKRNVALFLLINFFATVQGFIPSLFVAYALALGIFLFIYILTHKPIFISLKKAIFICILTLLINAYWLLPVGYFQINHGGVFLNAYNNITSTPHFIAVNNKYGDLGNVALIKGYLFDSNELGGPILDPWITHHNILVNAIGYAFFGLAVIGLFFSFFFLKNKIFKAFSGVFALFFISLATNAPPFSYIIALLQQLSATYAQAFRTSFTKFSIGVAFSYSLFIPIGMVALLYFVSRYGKKKALELLILGVLFFSLVYYALPSFQGHFLYDKLLIKIPQSYMDIMTYFNNQKDGRIADFPQDCSEGWYGYKWGYFGSGFYWYGVKQPFLARTFDVWSNYNENYFWEISQALREQNYQKIEALFQKYDVNWVLYDPNLLFCRDQKAIYTNQDFIKYLDTSPNYTLVQTFTDASILPIKLYKNNLPSAQSFVTFKENLPNIGPQYKFNDNDMGYYQSGDYASNSNSPWIKFYPFRSLFTKRGYQEKEFNIQSEEQSIIFSKELPQNVKDYLLKLDSYSTQEENLSITIHIAAQAPGKYQASVLLLFPQVFLNEKRITDINPEITIGTFKTNDIQNIKVFVNGNEAAKNSENLLYQSTLYFTLPNTIALIGENNAPLLVWNAQDDPVYLSSIQKDITTPLAPYAQGETLKVFVPKVLDTQIKEPFNIEKITPLPCDGTKAGNNKYELGNTNGQKYIRLIDQNSNQCFTFEVPNIITSFGYLLKIDARKIAGENPKLSIWNKGKVVYNDIYIYPGNSLNSFYYVIPPSFKSELGYTIKIENRSETNQPTINDFSDITIFPLPYRMLQTLAIQPSPVNTAQSLQSSIRFQVDHPNETVYIVKLTNPVATQNATTMILSQSYDTGWKAYEIKVKNQNSKVKSVLVTIFPFFFGEELKDHVLVNNWANGWLLDTNGAMNQSNNETIMIVYLPQYLEYAGFGILIATGVLIIMLPFWKRSA